MARSDQQQDEVLDALAALIASTRRGRRKLNLLDVADKLRIARQGKGGLRAVGEAVDLSPEMLRQFARVEKLTASVKDLVRKGAISGVDVADRISRLPESDQLPVAQAVVRGEINSKEVRHIVSFRRDFPAKPIPQVIERVKASRPIKEYVVEFAPVKGRSLRQIRRRFASLLGPQSIRAVETKRGVGFLVLSSHGRDRLQQLAKERRTTKRRVVEEALAEELG